MKEAAVKLAKQAAPIVRDEAVGIISNFFYKKLLLVNMIVAIAFFGLGVIVGIAVSVF